LMDLLYFRNPWLEAEQVCANLNFEYLIRTDDDEAVDEDLSIDICPDGTTSSTEKVRKALEDYRRAEEAEDNCEHGFDENDCEGYEPSCNLPGVKRLIETIPSQIVVTYLEHTFGLSKVKVYDNDRLCMTFDACAYPHYSYRAGKDVFILSLYLTPEQEEIYSRAKLNEETHTFLMEDGVKIISLTLSENPITSAMHITYYMHSLGYDPESLRYETERIDYE
ncbi:MAG: hypothetical protein K2K72_01220, partial [Duncaniella sp.]|nr:hypothetical protein [Duncaniella sp.]